MSYNGLVFMFVVKEGALKLSFSACAKSMENVVRIDGAVRFVPTALECAAFQSVNELRNVIVSFFANAMAPGRSFSSRMVSRAGSRSPRTRTVSKAAAKTAGGGSGDPDPEPEIPSYPFSLALPAFWQLLRPDNPGKNNLTKTLTDHCHPCASVSPIAFWSAA